MARRLDNRRGRRCNRQTGSARRVLQEVDARAIDRVARLVVSLGRML
ncbi:hypothetical protein [Cereibacter ovatus]|nr:hypothetical protein [Cereibacter ovatus]